MQKTAAQTHSCLCGLALIEEAAVWSRVGTALEELKRGRDAWKDRLMTSPEDLWYSALIGHLVRLADGGHFLSEECCGKRQAYCRVSDRMKRDMEVGLDNLNELVVENLRLMKEKEDQRSWI